MQYESAVLRRIHGRSWLWIFGFIISGLSSASGQETLYPTRTPQQRAAQLRTDRWIDIIEREIPTLSNDPGKRLPMIMWHGVGFEPLTKREIDILRSRGLCQHLQLDVSMIPAAIALQDAGMPVILMQGRTDSWPYSLVNKDQWAHQFDETYQPAWLAAENPFEWHGACPNRTAGWEILQRQTRRTIQQFHDAGVNLTGVWMDFEGDPYPWTHLFEQLKHCRRCRSDLPASILNEKSAWRDYAWQQYVDLYDLHFAKPIREVYPDCLVTNWHVVFSTQARPIRYFVRDVNLPVLSPKFFSATNPIAYASDQVWQERWPDANDPSNRPTQIEVDNFYTHEILQQVTADRLNREEPGKVGVASIPWVARYCKISDDKKRPAPMMTRENYRKSLGLLWEQGITTMQVFNAMHEGYEELAITELKDAVLAYDRSLSK